MVWDEFRKHVISLLLAMGFKHFIYHMKGYIFLYAKIEERMQMNMN